MGKFKWLKWFLYFVIAVLGLEVLKLLLGKINFSANYLIAIVLICIQTIFILGFIYYALFANIFGKKLKRNNFLLFFSTSFVCIVALLEILFSYWLYHPANIPPGLKWSYKFYYDLYNFRIMQYEKDVITFDDQLLYTLKPNAKITFNNAEFTTPVEINKSGFRDDDTSAIAPEIICLGDSFTMGWGIDESQSFPEIIGRATGKKVLNTGTSSYGTARELLLLERLDISNLKYIIIQYCSNDMEENVSFINNDYKLHLTPVPVFQSLVRSYELSRKYFPGKNFLLVSQIWMKHELNKIYPLFKFSRQPNTEEFNSREHASTFLKVLMRCGEKYENVKIIVTNVDANNYHDNKFIDELQQQSARMEAEKIKNIVVVNSMNDLADKDYFILDDHINYSGHKKVAATLLKAIKEDPVNELR